jgi:hypothetical protein
MLPDVSMMNSTLGRNDADGELKKISVSSAQLGIPTANVRTAAKATFDRRLR